MDTDHWPLITYLLIKKDWIFRGSRTGVPQAVCHLLYFFYYLKNDSQSIMSRLKLWLKQQDFLLFNPIQSYFTFRNYGTKGYCSRGKSPRSSSYYVKEPHRVKQSCPVKQICQTFNAFGQLKYKYFCKCGEDFFWQYHWISKNRKIVMRHVSIINLLLSIYYIYGMR